MKYLKRAWYLLLTPIAGVAVFVGVVFLYINDVIEGEFDDDGFLPMV